MLQFETYRKQYFKNLIVLKLNTIPNNHTEKNSCWLCEKEHNIED